MLIRVNLRIILFACVSFVMTASASAQEWRVALAFGPAWIGSQSTNYDSLAIGEIIPPGSSITTGNMGRALLFRGTQLMLVGPGTEIEFPEELQGKTTIIQNTGSAIFSVDKKKVPHFEVETPYLAAIVKGTIFSVRVAKVQTEVQVFRGNVEVSGHESDDSISVSAWHTAKIDTPDTENHHKHAPAGMGGAAATANGNRNGEGGGKGNGKGGGNDKGGGNGKGGGKNAGNGKGGSNANSKSR